MAKNFIVENMTLNDLEGVIRVHRNCFPIDVSFLSALSDKILYRYYEQSFKEKDNIALVLIESGTNLVAGYAMGTFRPGFQSRFLSKNRLNIIIDVLKGLIWRKSTWKALYKRFKKKGEHGLNSYNSVLKEKGVPLPNGPEFLGLVIAIDPKYRKPNRAIKLYKAMIDGAFEKGAYRIRGAMLIENEQSGAIHQLLGFSFRKISDTRLSLWKNNPSYNKNI
jgi:hypothetical protein